MNTLSAQRALLLVAEDEERGGVGNTHRKKAQPKKTQGV